MKSILVLENGSAFEGISAGLQGEHAGEVMLNTAVVGYQEIMTDPSNAGKIVIFTYPLIGNYGTAKKFYESKRSWVGGIAVKEISRIYSNWQAEESLPEFLKKEEVPAISDIDTRTVATTIRDNGEMLGIISTKSTDRQELLKKLDDYKKKGTPDFISKISVKTVTEVNRSSNGPKVAVLDLGILDSFIEQLKTLGCGITLLPYDTGPAKILAMKFDGLIVSNGPEGDVAIAGISETLKNILGKMPLMGISAGHEAIGLAIGGKLKKMKLGHHGVNYPVKPSGSLKGDITVQNHSYVIDDSLIKNRKDVEISSRNVNDDSIEAMESKKLRFLSTQYYPASPGFGEINEAFLKFMKMMPGTKKSARMTVSKVSTEVQYAKA